MSRVEKETARLPGVTVPLRLAPVADAAGEAVGHELEVSLAYHPTTWELHEIVFVGRGKIGHGLDLILQDLGIKLSRIIQGRDPETGEVVP